MLVPDVGFRLASGNRTAASLPLTADPPLRGRDKPESAENTGLRRRGSALAHSSNSLSANACQVIAGPKTSLAVKFATW